MNFLDALHTSSSGLSAQRLRMNLISRNLANANTTRTAQGGPYRRQEAVFATRQGDDSFHSQLKAQIVEDSRPPVLKYEPQHPDADAQGYVRLPNINMIEEMVNMMSASRSYEANVNAVRATRDMANKALEIGRR
jgi:flagellar basal-body rod protein FlgC